MTLSLLGVIFIDPNAYAAATSGLSAYYAKISLLFNDGLFSNLGDILSFVIALPILLVAVIFGAIYLPFTKKDLRGYCIVIPLIHLIMLIVANVMYILDDGINYINIFFLMYSLLWFFVIYFRLKEQDIDNVILPENDHGVDALFLGLMSLSIIFILTKLLQTNWVIAYSTAFFYSSYAGGLIKSIFSEKHAN